MHVHQTLGYSDSGADLRTIVKENTKTDDVHKPPHTREDNQWKNKLGKDTYIMVHQS